MPQNAIVSALIVVFIVVRFLMRELRERHLSRTQLFVLPAIVGAIALLAAGAAAVTQPAHAAVLAGAVAVAILIGIAFGFAVAHNTTVRTAADGRIFFRGSYATVAIWIGALALRLLARFALRSHAPGDTLVLNAALVVLVASALWSVRLLVRRKAIDERSRGSAITETAV